MANELELLTINAALDSWVDLVPDAISTGYQAQNTNIEGRSNGLESLYIEISGTDAIFNPSGVVDDNGAPMVVKTQVTLAVPSGQRFIRVIDGVDPTTRSLQIVSAIGVYDESKNGYYTSGDRMLNWSLNDISGSLKSYKILAPLHAHILGDTLLDGNITQTAGTTLLTGLNVAPNTDISIGLGRGKLGYISAGFEDVFAGAHIDRFNSTDFAWYQSAIGRTLLNHAVGQYLSIYSGGASETARFSDSIIELKKPTTITGHLDVSSYGLFGGAIYDTTNTLNVNGSGIISEDLSVTQDLGVGGNIFPTTAPPESSTAILTANGQTELIPRGHYTYEFEITNNIVGAPSNTIVLEKFTRGVWRTVDQLIRTSAGTTTGLPREGLRSSGSDVRVRMIVTASCGAVLFMTKY